MRGAHVLRATCFCVGLAAGCSKEKPGTAAPAGAGAPVSAGPDARSGPSVDCEGTCIVDYSVMDLGFGLPESDVQAAAAACEANHAGDLRCDATKWMAGRDAATCQVCKKEVDVEGDRYDVTVEYQEKFGYVYFVFRSPAVEGYETIHWVGAHDGVYKGPWTLEAGTDP